MAFHDPKGNVRPEPPGRCRRELQMTVIFNRRQILVTSSGAVAAAAWAGSVVPAAANDSADLIKAFSGGKTPAAGKVKIDMPEIAENGNTVPMTIQVDSPMTEQSYVKDVLVVADGHPRGGVEIG